MRDSPFSSLPQGHRLALHDEGINMYVRITRQAAVPFSYPSGGPLARGREVV
jgi:hypothetical protein